jgi:uncharacterized membrane protein
MAHKTRYEKAKELLEQARQERNPAAREIMFRAARRYFDADVNNPMNDTPDNTKYILILMGCYLMIFLSVVLSFAFLSVYAAVLVIIGAFALLCLMMGVILRSQGLLSEPGLLKMVSEGFRALLLLRKR